MGKYNQPVSEYWYFSLSLTFLMKILINQEHIDRIYVVKSVCQASLPSFLTWASLAIFCLDQSQIQVACWKTLLVKPYPDVQKLPRNAESSFHLVCYHIFVIMIFIIFSSYFHSIFCLIKKLCILPKFAKFVLAISIFKYSKKNFLDRFLNLPPVCKISFLM